MEKDGSAQVRVTTNVSEDTPPDWQWRAVDLPPPPPVTAVSFQGRWHESEYLGVLEVTGTVPRQVKLRFVVRQKQTVVLARTEVVRGRYRVRLRMPRTVLPGRYVLDARQASGLVAVRPQQEPVTLVPPPEGVVKRAWASTTLGGRPLEILPPSPDAFAQFRFAVLPRAGRTLVAQWYWRGKPVGQPRRRQRAPLVIANLFVEDALLPRGPYECVLRAGGTVVGRVSFRVV